MAIRRDRRDGTPPFRRSVFETPWGFGALYGAAAYVAGYLVTALLVAVSAPPTRPFGGFAGAVVTAFYGAHAVPVAVGGATVDGLAVLAGDPVPAEAFTLVPVAALVLAGNRLARGYVGLSDQQAVKAGATVAVGYLLAAVAGALLLGSGRAPRPDLLRTVVVMGGLFPVACGAAGGYLARA